MWSAPPSLPSGLDAIQWQGILDNVLIPSLLAPILGLLTAAALMIAVLWIVRRRSPGIVNRVFRRLQLVSGGFVAFTHGTNDAQKTMGIIALALVSTGHLDPDFDRPPLWVIVSAALAMGIGTYVGGWRIIRTLGTRIAKLDPPRGFAAQTSRRRSSGSRPTTGSRSRRRTPCRARCSARGRRGG